MAEIQGVLTECDFDGIPEGISDIPRFLYVLDYGLKFVAVMNPTQDVQLGISHGGIEHAILARALLARTPGSTFLGAGEQNMDGFRWGSTSCVEEFGFDKPQGNSHEMNVQLLADIVSAIGLKIQTLTVEYEEK